MTCYVDLSAMSMPLGGILTVVVMLCWIVGGFDLLCRKFCGERYVAASGELGLES
jgi:hypothetical protein